MRAQNHKEIYTAYRQFSGYLAICVIIAVFSFFFYRQTAQIEVDRIVDKTEEYDKIYVRQMDLTSRIDSLYYYTTLFNTNDWEYKYDKEGTATLYKLHLAIYKLMIKCTSRILSK